MHFGPFIYTLDGYEKKVFYYCKLRRSAFAPHKVALDLIFFIHD